MVKVAQNFQQFLGLEWTVYFLLTSIETHVNISSCNCYAHSATDVT